jgi:hypothetical protein
MNVITSHPNNAHEILEDPPMHDAVSFLLTYDKRAANGLNGLRFMQKITYARRKQHFELIFVIECDIDSICVLVIRFCTPYANFLLAERNFLGFCQTDRESHHRHVMTEFDLRPRVSTYRY